MKGIIAIAALYGLAQAIPVPGPDKFTPSITTNIRYISAEVPHRTEDATRSQKGTPTPGGSNVKPELCPGCDKNAPKRPVPMKAGYHKLPLSKHSVDVAEPPVKSKTSPVVLQLMKNLFSNLLHTGVLPVSFPGTNYSGVAGTFQTAGGPPKIDIDIHVSGLDDASDAQVMVTTDSGTSWAIELPTTTDDAADADDADDADATDDVANADGPSDAPATDVDDVDVEDTVDDVDAPSDVTDDTTDDSSSSIAIVTSSSSAAAITSSASATATTFSVLIAIPTPYVIATSASATATATTSSTIVTASASATRNEDPESSDEEDAESHLTRRAYLPQGQMTTHEECDKIDGEFISSPRTTSFGLCIKKRPTQSWRGRPTDESEWETPTQNGSYTSRRACEAAGGTFTAAGRTGYFGHCKDLPALQEESLIVEVQEKPVEIIVTVQTETDNAIDSKVQTQNDKKVPPLIDLDSIYPPQIYKQEKPAPETTTADEQPEPAKDNASDESITDVQESLPLATPNSFSCPLGPKDQDWEACQERVLGTLSKFTLDALLKYDEKLDSQIENWEDTAARRLQAMTTLDKILDAYIEQRTKAMGFPQKRSAVARPGWVDLTAEQQQMFMKELLNGPPGEERTWMDENTKYVGSWSLGGAPASQNVKRDDGGLGYQYVAFHDVKPGETAAVPFYTNPMADPYVAAAMKTIGNAPASQKVKRDDEGFGYEHLTFQEVKPGEAGAIPANPNRLDHPILDPFAYAKALGVDNILEPPSKADMIEGAIALDKTYHPLLSAVAKSIGAPAPSTALGRVVSLLVAMDGLQSASPLQFSKRSVEAPPRSGSWSQEMDLQITAFFQELEELHKLGDKSDKHMKVIAKKIAEMPEMPRRLLTHSLRAWVRANQPGSKTEEQLQILEAILPKPETEGVRAHMDQMMEATLEASMSGVKASAHRLTPATTTTTASASASGSTSSPTESETADSVSQDRADHPEISPAVIEAANTIAEYQYQKQRMMVSQVKDLMSVLMAKLEYMQANPQETASPVEAALEDKVVPAGPAAEAEALPQSQDTQGFEVPQAEATEVSPQSAEAPAQTVEESVVEQKTDTPVVAPPKAASNMPVKTVSSTFVMPKGVSPGGDPFDIDMAISNFKKLIAFRELPEPQQTEERAKFWANLEVEQGFAKPSGGCGCGCDRIKGKLATLCKRQCDCGKDD